uniref:Mediator of RNA polymerase II transcription subunit 7 n=1 Tax=Rhabditophanes sp. KR3021 TaxID=114890 RepID=A0AC35U5J8_9BILA
MADNSKKSDSDQVNSPFPLPPAYYKKFLTKRVEAGITPKPPPVPDKYNVFGETVDWTNIGDLTLEELGIERLYDLGNDYKEELKKINDAIIGVYLDLVDMLIISPLNPKRAEKVLLLKSLFINFHFILNKLRRIQANDVVIATAIDQIEDLECEVYTLNRHTEYGRLYALDAVNDGLRKLNALNEIAEENEKPIDEEAEHKRLGCELFKGYKGPLKNDAQNAWILKEQIRMLTKEGFKIL